MTEEGSTPRVRQALLSVTSVLLTLLHASTPELEVSITAALAACDAAGSSNVALIHPPSQPDLQADISIAACTGVKHVSLCRSAPLIASLRDPDNAGWLGGIHTEGNNCWY